MREHRRGSCHCGAVTFDVSIDLEAGKLVACNCSLCTRKTRGVGLVAAGDFTLRTGENDLGVYQWNTGRERHFFCKTCGIHTHHELADPPPRIAVNLACIEGVENGSLVLTLGDGVSIPIVNAASPDTHSS